LRIYATGDERLLPRDRREESEQHHDKLRACVDHVASMTEPGAIAMHHRLTGIRTGLHSDQIWRT
jgi:dGTPase